MEHYEQKQLVDDLRALADFYERPESVVLPVPYIQIYETVSEYHPYDNGWEENLEASKTKLKQYVSALGSCEKDWRLSDLCVTKAFGFIKLTFSVNREAVCTKKVIGTEKRQKRAYVEIPNEFEEVEKVEWVCEDVSLLK